MPTYLPSLNALRYFEAAARHLSFKRAAEELSVSPTAISHQIRDLEDYFGQALFVRLPRRLELTPEAEYLYLKVREGLTSFAEGVRGMRALSGKVELKITVPPAFASRWLVPRLTSFTNSREDVTLHLNGSLETIDDSRRDNLNFGLSPQADEKKSEIVIRYGIGSPVPGYSVQPFLQIDYVLVCSPAIQSKLKRPEDIKHFVQIHDDTIPDERLRPSWDNWCAKAGIDLELEASGPHFHDYGMVLAAVADGMGTALSPLQLIGADLADGRIIAPFDILVPSAYCYYLVVPETIIERPEVIEFCAWIKREASLNSE